MAVATAGKESACNAETWVQSLGWEYPLEKGKATHYSGLENPMDYTVKGVAKSWTRLSNFFMARGNGSAGTRQGSEIESSQRRPRAPCELGEGCDRCPERGA